MFVLAPVLILFSLLYNRKTTFRDIKWYWYLILAASCLLPASLFTYLPADFYYDPDYLSERMLYLGDAGYWFSMGVMMACVLSLMNIEATLSALSSEERWRIKYEMLGLVAIIAVLIFYYSQGLLYRSINARWLPARSVVLILAVGCIAYSRFFRGSGTRVVVSQFIVYRSMTLLAVGLYLVILGLIGEGMEHFEVPFHRALVMIIFFAAGMGLIAMMLSNRLRRRTKVLVSKHFMAPKHDYRSEWISFTNKLAVCRTLADLEQAILAVYGETFGFAGTALYLRDRAQGTYRLAQKTRFSKGQPEFVPGPSLRSYFLARDRVLNPLDAEHSLTPEERVFVARSEATFIVPMVYGDQLDGLIVLGGQLAPGELIYEDYDLMKIMARQAGYEFGRQWADSTGGTTPSELLAPLDEAGAGVSAETVDGRLQVTTRTCLFREVAARRPRLVCILDRAITEGLLSRATPPYAMSGSARRGDQNDSCVHTFETQGRIRALDASVRSTTETDDDGMDPATEDAR